MPSSPHFRPTAASRPQQWRPSSSAPSSPCCSCGASGPSERPTWGGRKTPSTNALSASSRCTSCCLFSSSPDLKGLTMPHRFLTSRFAQRAAVALGAAALPALSFAQGLPQLENPTRGAGSGIMETIRNYGYDIIMLVALLVVASMFIGVCYHAYGTYAEIHTGRKTWGQFGLTVAIGAVLLVIGIWLLTEATGIL